MLSYDSVCGWAAAAVVVVVVAAVVAAASTTKGAAAAASTAGDQMMDCIHYCQLPTMLVSIQRRGLIGQETGNACGACGAWTAVQSTDAHACYLSYLNC